MWFECNEFLDFFHHCLRTDFLCWEVKIKPGEKGQSACNVYGKKMGIGERLKTKIRYQGKLIQVY